MTNEAAISDYQSETRRICRDHAISIVAKIIHDDRQDTPHDLAVAIVDALTQNWLIRG